MAIGQPSAMTGPLVEAKKIGGSKDYKAGMPIWLNTDYVVTFLDFLNPDDYDTTDWSLTAVDTDTDALHSVAVQAGTKNGELKITNNNNALDSINIQHKIEGWKLEAGKKLWFETNMEVSTADQLDFVIGLAITDTTALASTDNIHFRLTDGSAAITCVNGKDSTETSTASGVDRAANTKVKLGFVCDGVGSIEFYVNRNKVATHTTNIVDDEELCITVHLKNGSAAAHTASIDYILVARER